MDDELNLTVAKRVRVSDSVVKKAAEEYNKPRRRRKPRKKAEGEPPVTIRKKAVWKNLHPLVRDHALELAKNDKRRIKIVDEETVVVMNHPIE